MPALSVEPRKRGNRRLISVVVLGVILVVQAGIAITASREPFPAIIMPGFGASADADGIFRTTQLHITVAYDDGTTLEPTFDELMDGFRFSSARPSLDYIFHPYQNPGVKNLPSSVVTWLRERAAGLGNDAEPESVSFCWQPTAIELREASATPIGDCVVSEVQL